MATFKRAIKIFLCAVPMMLVCFSCGELMLPLAFSITVHECGHLFMLRALNGKICAVRPAPFGLCIEFDNETLSLIGEMAVSVAGCVFNIVAFAISLMLYMKFGINAVDFVITNAALALINLIPVKPLDGGRIFSLVLEYFFGERTAYILSGIFTVFLGFLAFLFTSYSLLTSENGVYPVLFSIYVIMCGMKSLENVFFEEKQSI